MPNLEKINLYNPLPEDITVTYDYNSDGYPLSFTLHAQEIESFDPVIAEHITKHLVDAMINKRGLVGGNAELTKEAFKKEIVVEI